MFPIPKITESFIDGVLYDLGWVRYTDHYTIESGVPNADYIEKSSVGELKIFEEEGLLKEERQNKISLLFNLFGLAEGVVDLNVEDIPEEFRSKYEDIVSRPFQSAIKKASKQLKSTAEKANLIGDRVIFAVNNGYSSLNADNFERLFVSRCKRDSRTISHAACITIDYYQGNFDSFINCSIGVHKINSNDVWRFEAAFTRLVQEYFNKQMTYMMANQMNPELQRNSIEPVKSIFFEREGVRYEFSSPTVPDYRYPD